MIVSLNVLEEYFYIGGYDITVPNI